MSVEQAASKTLTTNVEKHRVVATCAAGAAKDSAAAAALSVANARLVQVDLAVATITPFVVTHVTSQLGFRNAIVFLVLSQLAVAAGTLPLALRTADGGNRDMHATVAADRRHQQRYGEEALSVGSTSQAVSTR